MQHEHLSVEPSPQPGTPTPADQAKTNNALGSWHDTAAKKSILDFVARVTDPTDAGYVAPQERIATFDIDGTLWCEQPAVQGGFIMQRLTTMANMGHVAAPNTALTMDRTIPAD